MIDEKIVKWEQNNPNELSTNIRGKYKGTDVDTYRTYHDVYTMTNLEDGIYFRCDWCDEGSDYYIDDETKTRFFETRWELYMHFVEEHDLLENYEEIEVNEQGVMNPEQSTAYEVADEILKKKGLSIRIGDEDAINLALNNEIDAEL